jgi:hypothetical protein
MRMLVVLAVGILGCGTPAQTGDAGTDSAVESGSSDVPTGPCPTGLAPTACAGSDASVCAAAPTSRWVWSATTFTLGENPNGTYSVRVCMVVAGREECTPDIRAQQAPVPVAHAFAPLTGAELAGVRFVLRGASDGGTGDRCAMTYDVREEVRLACDFMNYTTPAPLGNGTFGPCPGANGFGEGDPPWRMQYTLRAQP